MLGQWQGVTLNKHSVYKNNKAIYKILLEINILYNNKKSSNWGGIKNVQLKSSKNVLANPLVECINEFTHNSIVRHVNNNKNNKDVKNYK